MKPQRRRVQFNCSGESRTKQAFKDECDINNILKKYNKTNLLSHVNQINGSYGDFTGIVDYQTAHNAVIDAHERFMGLPAKIRAKFNNDPSQLLNYLSDPSNQDEAISHGLLISKPKTLNDSIDELNASIKTISSIPKPVSKSTKGDLSDD